MPPSTPVDIPEEAFAALEGLRAAIEAVIPQPLEFAIGIKQIGGEYQEDLALVVLVPTKLPPEEVPVEELIPEEFAGFLTDVVQFRPEEITDSAPYDPLRGGIQISRPAFLAPDGVSMMVKVGTLGAIVRSRSDGRRQLLTNNHVLPTVGVPVHQPGDLTTGHRVVGTSGVGITAAWLDCAVAEVASGQATTPAVAGVGAVRGTSAVSLFEPVKKRGARTELTTGLVVSIIPGTVLGSIRGMIIDTFPFGGLFCWSGDSGSVILNSRDEVVGLLFAMNDNQTDPLSGTPIRSVGVASTIGPVLDALAVDVAVAPGVTSIAPDNALDLLATFGQVTVSGWGFDGTSQVTFGGTPALATQFVSTAEIIVTPPVMPFVGIVGVVVSNAFGELSEPGPGAVFTF